MATIIRREIRKRGFFGWIFLILFWGFNALMLLWLIAGIASVSQTHADSHAAEVGGAVGAFIGVTMIFIIWGAGAVVLGLFALLTRGSKTIIEETQQ
jgi:Ca2+/H+ antiporter